jgi:hypothetical protein
MKELKTLTRQYKRFEFLVGEYMQKFPGDFGDKKDQKLIFTNL